MATCNVQEARHTYTKRHVWWCGTVLLLAVVLFSLVGCPKILAVSPDIAAPKPVIISGADVTTTSSSTLLQWSPSTSDSVAKIQIVWTPEHGIEQPKIITNGETSTTITELHSNTAYTFSIAAIDTYDNASTAVEVSATTPPSTMRFAQELYSFMGVQGAPGSVVNTVSPIVEPVAAGAPAITLTYKIIEKTDDDSALFVINPTTGEIAVGNTSALDATHTYRFTVQATSSQGVTATTDILVFPLDTTAPAPVTALNATKEDTGSGVTLNWTDSNSADATQVHITWVKSGGSTVLGSRTAAHGDEIITISGLTSETSYIFSLIVEDDAGLLSSAVTVTTTTLDVTIPAPVTNVQVAQAADTANATISWLNSSSSDAAMLDIAWSSTVAGVASGSISIPSGTGSSIHIIDGLIPSTPYTITITVVDTSGNMSTTSIANPNPFSILAPFSVLPNGVTIVCAGVAIGNTFNLNGIAYTRRNAADITAGNAATTCTTGATSMNSLFRNQGTFNADISHWDVSSVEDMQNMFIHATTFNADISHWDVGNVKNMINMFASARAFNADISRWDVSSMEYMQLMFNGAAAFDQDISNWDVGSVKTMRAMFQSAIAFNQDISRWDVSSVTDTRSMFRHATAFNQDLRGWCVHHITAPPTNFDTYSALSPSIRPMWGTCPDPSLLTNPIDTDGDELIDVSSRMELHNMRYNLAGTSYKTSSSDGGVMCGTALDTACRGYELMQNLTFDRDGGGTYNTTTYALDSGDHHDIYFPVTSSNTGGWLPIGDAANPFSTLFEGNGFYIRGLATRRNTEYVGMFGYIDSRATIRNIRLTNTLADYTGNSGANIYVGGLAGYNDGTISASHVGGPVTGGVGSKDRIGGLTGVNSGIIIASYASGKISGGSGNFDYVGGLVGQNSGTIVASYASGIATGGTGSNNRIGGLTGVNSGTITASYASGTAAGSTGNTDRIGGLTGQNSGIITASYASGTATGGTGSADGVGGLTGVNSGIITASYATGAANGGAGIHDSVGALAGYHIGTITASYGFGNISGAEHNGTDDSGDRPTNWRFAVGTGINGARAFYAPGTASFRAAPPTWNQAKRHNQNAWNFGNSTQAPALRYADYDGAGSTYGCGTASTATIVIPDRVPAPATPGGIIRVICGTTLLGGPQPR